VAGVTARREDRAVREARRPRWLLTIPEIRMMDRLRQLHNLDLDIRAGTHQILGDYIRFDLPTQPTGLPTAVTAYASNSTSNQGAMIPRKSKYGCRGVPRRSQLTR
jgi:hypothetical protein